MKFKYFYVQATDRKRTRRRCFTRWQDAMAFYRTEKARLQNVAAKGSDTGREHWLHLELTRQTKRGFSGLQPGDLYTINRNDFLVRVKPQRRSR